MFFITVHLGVLEVSLIYLHILCVALEDYYINKNCVLLSFILYRFAVIRKTVISCNKYLL